MKFVRGSAPWCSGSWRGWYTKIHRTCDFSKMRVMRRIERGNAEIINKSLRCARRRVLETKPLMISICNRVRLVRRTDKAKERGSLRAWGTRDERQIMWEVGLFSLRPGLPWCEQIVLVRFLRFSLTVAELLFLSLGGVLLLHLFYHQSSFCFMSNASP